MTQAKKSQLLPAHYRILASIEEGKKTELTLSDRKALERDYRFGAPGVSDDPSMIDFFDTPRSTLFEGMVRIWNSTNLAFQHSGVLEEAKSIKVVDVGGGRGETFRVAKSIRVAKDARFDFEILDIDIRKRELFCRLFPNDSKRYRIHDFREGLPYQEGEVDAFICLEAIEHVSRVAGICLLDEMHRCLSPSGILVMTTPNAEVRKEAISIYHEYEWGAEELKEAVQSAGFEIIEWFFLGVPAKELKEFLPEGWRTRMHSDLLRATLGPASGKRGSVTSCVLRKRSS